MTILADFQYNYAFFILLSLISFFFNVYIYLLFAFYSPHFKRKLYAIKGSLIPLSVYDKIQAMENKRKAVLYT